MMLSIFRLLNHLVLFFFVFFFNMHTSHTNSTKQLLPVIIAATVAKFIVGTFALSFSPLLPEISNDLSITPTMLGLAGGSYGFSSAFMALTGSFFQSKFKRELLIVVGIFIHFLGIVCTGLACNLSMLLFGKIVCGIGAGLLLPATVAYLSDRTPYSERAKVLSTTNIGWAACTLVGAPFLAFIGNNYTWRIAQFFLLIFWLLAITLLLFSRKIKKLSDEITSAKAAPTQSFKDISLLRLVLSTFFLFVGFYGIYSFLGVAIDKDKYHSINISWTILCYGLGFLTATFYTKFISKVKAEKVFAITLIGLAVLIPLISFCYFKTLPFVYVAMYLWGNLQNVAFTSTTTIASGTSENIRGKALSLNQFALSFGFSMGTFLMGLLLSESNFFVVGIVCGLSSLIAAIIMMPYAHPLLKINNTISENVSR